MATPYPGKLINDETGYRILKCYIYKFAKNRITLKPRFNTETKSFTLKKFYWFNTLRPIVGTYHNHEHIERLDNIKTADFIANEETAYFMPQYSQQKNQQKRKTLIYKCSGADIIAYLGCMKLEDLQNITIFNSTFTWAIDIFDDTLPGHHTDMDVLTYVKRPTLKTGNVTPSHLFDNTKN